MKCCSRKGVAIQKRAHRAWLTAPVRAPEPARERRGSNSTFQWQQPQLALICTGIETEILHSSSNLYSSPVTRSAPHSALQRLNFLLFFFFLLPFPSASCWMKSDVAFLLPGSRWGIVSRRCRAFRGSVPAAAHKGTHRWTFSLLLTRAQLCGRRGKKVIPMEGGAVKLPLWIMIISDISSSFWRAQLSIHA